MIPSMSFAVEEKFFEFATDVGAPIEVPTGSIAVQEFKIYNDYINAIDLWFDNTGGSGSVTVALLNANDTLIASKVVSVAHSDPFYTGQQLHVKFNTTISVNSGDWYKVRVTSNAPKLRLYGIKRVQFVEHDAPYPMDSAVGASSLNGDAQLAVFKFALYEETDSEAPVITNASSTIAGPDSVRISFNANELVDRTLSYTPIGSGNVSVVPYTGNYSICFEDIFSCPLVIDTQRDTMYTYRLTVRDSKGNEAFFDGAFESWKPGVPVPPQDPSLPPVTPPSETTPSPTEAPVVPLTITSARVVSVTNESVQLSWDTDRAANSTMIISTDPVGGRIVANVTDGTYELVHTIKTGKGLAAGVDYYATIISHDEAGVMAAKVLTFTTESRTTIPVTPPSETTSLPPLQTYVSQDQQAATFSWSAPAGGEPTEGYRVDVIDEQGKLFRTIRVPAGTHTAEVSGLTGGEYRAVAYADNEGVVEKVAPAATVAVRKRAKPIDTYELIKKPIFYIPAGSFVLLIAGLYWYSKREKKSIIQK